MPVRHVTFAPARPDADAFWDAVAAALDGDGMPRRVFVPDAAHVEPCRAALRRRQARASRAWIAPCVVTFDNACARMAPARVARSDAARMFQIHRALERLPDLDADARLVLAARLVGSLDRLEQAAAVGALEAVGPLSACPGDEALRTLCALRDALGTPDDPVRLQAAGRAALADSCEHDALVHWLPLSAAQRDWAQRAGATGIVRVAALDAAALATVAPVAAAAWPEAFGLPAGDLRARAAAAGLQAAPLVLQGRDREDEVQAAAQWICMRRATGCGAIDVVVPDPWAARRLHALLARAGVRMADAVGTRLSDTVAAAAIVRWVDLALADAPPALLSAWLSSPFVFGDEAASGQDGAPGLDAHGCAAVLEWIDAAAARGRWLGGWPPLLAAPGLRQDWREALAILARLAAVHREAGTAAQHAHAVRAALQASGAWRALEADPIGCQVLVVFERLADAACDAGQEVQLTGAQWRTLLARELDRAHCVEHAAEGPVRRIGLEAAVAGGSDALIVVGVVSGTLPAASEPDPFFTDALDARLGLPSRAEDIEHQLRRFALALAMAPQAALTCRQDPVAGSERSPWVERLLAVRAGSLGAADAVVAARAFAQAQAVRLRAAPLRGADGPGRGLLPERLSVTDIEQLGACPYRFWTQALLGLREPREPLDAPRRRELGTFVHAVLFEFHRQLSRQPLGRADARRLLESVTDAQAARQAAGGFVPLLAEWRATLPRYLDWLAQRGAQAWRWQDGEVALDAAFTVGDLQVTVRGRVDRIDAAMRDGHAIHAVIDYKVGTVQAHRRRAGEPDEFAQLPLYLLLMQRAGLDPVEAGFLAIDRDRIELVPLTRAVRGRRTARSADPVEVAARWHDRLQRTLERIEAAEPLQALGHQQECGRCAMRGICRRQHWLQDASR